MKENEKFQKVYNDVSFSRFEMRPGISLMLQYGSNLRGKGDDETKSFLMFHRDLRLVSKKTRGGMEEIGLLPNPLKRDWKLNEREINMITSMSVFSNQKQLLGCLQNCLTRDLCEEVISKRNITITVQ